MREVLVVVEHVTVATVKEERVVTVILGVLVLVLGPYPTGVACMNRGSADKGEGVVESLKTGVLTYSPG